MADKPLGKKHGRKKQGSSISSLTESSNAESANNAQKVAISDPSLQIINQLANALLLSGGLKADDNTVVQFRFAELPAPIQTQLRAFIATKLALNILELKE